MTTPSEPDHARPKGRFLARRHRVSEYRLVSVLRELDDALGNACRDGLVPQRKALGLMLGCRRFVARLTGFGWWDALPLVALGMRAVNARKRHTTVIRAREHVDVCMEFLQAAIARTTASLLDDRGLEAHVAATIDLLAPTHSEGDSSW